MVNTEWFVRIPTRPFAILLRLISRSCATYSPLGIPTRHFAIRYSPLEIPTRPFATRYSPLEIPTRHFAIRYSPLRIPTRHFAIRYSPLRIPTRHFAIRYWLKNFRKLHRPMEEAVPLGQSERVLLDLRREALGRAVVAQGLCGNTVLVTEESLEKSRCPEVA